MISGMPDTVGPLFYSFNIPDCFQIYKKPHAGFGQIWKRLASDNDEDPPNKILGILNMGPISTRKHATKIW